jgi:fructuronate reductase
MNADAPGTDSIHSDAATTLPRLSPERLTDAFRPRVHPESLTAGVIHLGVGAFHRAHQAVYTEDAIAESGQTQWGILAVTGRTGRVADQLAPQSGLFEVLELGAHRTHARVIGSLVGVTSPRTATPKLLDAVGNPRIHVVTITITEKAYPGRTVPIEHDHTLRADILRLRDELTGLGNDDPADNPITLLTRGIARRWLNGGAPLTVMSCDNLTQNGEVVQAAVAGLIAAAGAAGATAEAVAFLEWLHNSVTFPSSVVDRIVPVTTAADHKLAERITGFRDEALVVAEEFHEWIIEDRFAGPRPPWELAGAMFVPDIRPYEELKLRVLNAAHSLVAYAGVLAGHTTVAEAMADLRIRDMIVSMIDEDVLPTVDGLPHGALTRYRDTVFERFQNPRIRHGTLRIAMDGSQKISQRWARTIEANLQIGRIPCGLAAAIAAWIGFIALTTSPGGPALDDPLGDILRSALVSVDRLCESGREREGIIRDILAVVPEMPTIVIDSTAFHRAVSECLGTWLPTLSGTSQESPNGVRRAGGRWRSGRGTR